MPSVRLGGSIAMVTGASRGIGKSIALQFAREGADVALNCRSRTADAEAVCAQIRAMGRRAIWVRADVSVASEVTGLVASVTEALGPVDILVNNAASADARPIEELTEAGWNAVIANNLTSAFLVTQGFLPAMRNNRKGRIIYISSAAAQIGGVIGPHYAASKAGMLGLTHSYASLLAREGITVNAIAPALIETDMIAGNKNVRRDLIPVGRLGDVSEVADVAVLLASNGYITGQTVNVNGGWYMS